MLGSHAGFLHENQELVPSVLVSCVLCIDKATTRGIYYFSFCFFQYMFFFQLPYLPEFAIEMNDFHMLGAVYKVLISRDDPYNDAFSKFYQYYWQRCQLK